MADILKIHLHLQAAFFEQSLLKQEKSLMVYYSRIVNAVDINVITAYNQSFFYIFIIVSMNPQKTESRVLYFDLLRVIAIIAVVVLHNSVDLVDQYGIMPTMDWSYAAFYNGISRFCVPMFVLLSGALLLNPAKEVTIRELFNKRLLKLVIPLVFWSAIYVGFDYYTQGNFADFSFKDNLITFYKGPVIFHFWFLYMLIGIYLMYPIINAFIKSAPKSYLKYFIILWFITNSIFGMITILFETPIGIDLTGFTGYIGYFVLGYYLKTFVFSKQTLYVIYTLSIIAFIASALGIILLYEYHIKQVVKIVESDFTPELPLIITGLFLWMKNGSYDFIMKQKWLQSLILDVSKESYGIYIIHVLIMQLIFDQAFLYLHYNYLNNFWSIPLNVLITILFSYIIIKILKLVPFLKLTI